MNYKLNDSEIISVIDAELSNAIGNADSLSDMRMDALDYYMGNATGKLAPPSVDGRSSVVDKTLMEAVDWIMPSFMRLFCGSDQVARFDADNQEDEKAADDASTYVNYVINEQNSGFVLIHDAIKNALMQRFGIVKVYTEDVSETRTERYENLTALDLQSLQSDKTVQIEKVEQVDEELFNVSVKVETRKKKCVTEGVPPEEFRMNRDAKTIEKARFVAHEVKRTRSELLGMGVKASTLDEISGEHWENSESLYRSSVDDLNSYDESGDESQETIYLTECFLYIDTDGDGVSEYRRIVKVGNVILINEEADEHPFVMFSCILMPYQAVGLSLYDLLKDIVEIKTVINRQMLDNLYLANNQRTAVVEGQVNLDDILNPRPGGIVRMKQLGMAQDMTTPFIADGALSVLQHFNKVGDTRSGATAFNAGLGGAELAGTNIGSNGYQDMANGAMQRVELMARVIAETGIKRLYKLVLKEVTQHQDRPVQMKINGKWLEIDPREWKNQYRLTLSVGMVSASRQQQITNMQQVLQLQGEAQQYGLADKKNAYNALSRLVENMGYRDASQFFTYDENEQPEEQGPPPELQIAQMKTDADKEKASHQAEIDIQVETAKQQSQSVQAKEQMQMDLARDKIRMDNDKEMAKFKAELDYNLAVKKAEIEANKAIQVAHINAQARIGQAVGGDSTDAGLALYDEQENSMNELDANELE